jgi:hypothetical protein
MEMKRPYSEFCAALTLAGCVLPESFGDERHIPASAMAEAPQGGKWWIVGSEDAAATVAEAYGIPFKRETNPIFSSAYVCFEMGDFFDHIDLDR